MRATTFGDQCSENFANFSARLIAVRLITVLRRHRSRRPRAGQPGGRLGPDAAPGPAVARGDRALSRAPAPGPAAESPADGRATGPVRGRRRRSADGLDQRPRAGALSDALEPLRPVRP